MPEADLISRSKLISTIRGMVELPNEVRAQVLAAVGRAKAVDAVPVVRCKDCKHWLHLEYGFGDCTNGRFHIDGCVDPTMEADDFCSCGERRTGA